VEPGARRLSDLGQAAEGTLPRVLVVGGAIDPKTITDSTPEPTAPAMAARSMPIGSARTRRCATTACPSLIVCTPARPIVWVSTMPSPSAP